MLGGVAVPRFRVMRPDDGGRLAYPHLSADALDRLAAPRLALSAQVVAPLEAVRQIAGQDDLPADVQLMLGAEERMRRHLQRDGHVERVLERQRTVLEVGHLDAVLVCGGKSTSRSFMISRNCE